jgi:hypothetical protein
MNEMDRRAAERVVRARIDASMRAAELPWPQPRVSAGFDKISARWPNLVVDANAPIRAFLNLNHAERQQMYTTLYAGRTKVAHAMRPYMPTKQARA